MQETSRAFTFVDRITGVEAGKSARGWHQIPAQLKEFPPALLAEATGQLAAWTAMSALDFRFRPVAGIAGRLELRRLVRPGERLALAVELEQLDEESVRYHGTAAVEGETVLQLHDCVGPMMPMTDFNDPAAVRARFAALCAGELPSEFSGLPALPLEEIEESGDAVAAHFQVPRTAEFFADHFARRPVFPGTLLLHVNLQFARRLLPPAARVHEITDTKMRAFVLPGDRLVLRAQRLDGARLKIEAMREGKIVSRARAAFIAP